MKKIRTLSMSSSNQGDDVEAGSRANTTNGRQIIVPPPPAYSISLQHPVLVRSTADIDDSRSDAPDTSNEDDVSVSAESSSSEDQADPNAQHSSGYAFPGDNLFIPPPYCRDPPAYSEQATEDNLTNGVDDQAPSYSYT